MVLSIKSTTAVMLACATLGGCASKAKNISAAYVSPLTYENYSCDQLVTEAGRVSQRAADISGVQNRKAKNDAVAAGVGIVLFWPALLFIKGNSATESEVARLKGEMNAIEEISIQKNCSIKFERA